MLPWLIPAIIGGIGSLIGGIGASQRANEALGLQREQIEMAKRLQDYLFKRQALVDPIFKDLLSQALYRANRAPFFAGQYHDKVAPIFGALRGGRAELPPPQLIGGKPEVWDWDDEEEDEEENGGQEETTMPRLPWPTWLPHIRPAR